MSASKNVNQVVTIGKPSPTQQQIVAALSSSSTEDEFELAGILEPSENLNR